MRRRFHDEEPVAIDNIYLPIPTPTSFMKHPSRKSIVILVIIAAFLSSMTALHKTNHILPGSSLSQTHKKKASIFHESSEHPLNLRIVTWNLRVPFPSDAKKNLSWNERRSSVASAIATHQPDLMALQEDFYLMSESLLKSSNNNTAQIGTKNTLSETYERYGLFNRNGEFRPSSSWPENPFTLDGTKDGEHNSVWYNKARFSSLQNMTFWLSRTPEKEGSSFDEVTGRVVNCALLQDEFCAETTTCLIFFCSTHFPAGNQTRSIWSAHALSDVFSLIQKDLTKSYLARGNNNNNNVRFDMFVSGDFNSIPGSKTHEAMIQAGFVDTRTLSIEEKPMDDYDYTTNDWYSDNGDSLIDYVWLYKGASSSSGASHDVKRHFRVQSVKHVSVPCCNSNDDATQANSPFFEQSNGMSNRTASDHKMVVVDFEFY
mmetsp:Transcript_40920/g.59800  ORF Transcript_40920/g.59800 Transcript_40920/m.59800 type:complete len:430 (+) Transcript_40920:71-1360(+)